LARGATPSGDYISDATKTNAKGAHTDSNHQYFARPNHVHDALSVLEHLQHHLLLGLRRRSVFGVRTWVHDSIHVEVKVVHLFALSIKDSTQRDSGIRTDFAIGVRLRVINRDLDAIDDLRFLLDDRRHDLRIPLRKPSEQGWNTHIVAKGSTSGYRMRVE
jgi:hypothetical protein